MKLRRLSLFILIASMALQPIAADRAWGNSYIITNSSKSDLFMTNNVATEISTNDPNLTISGELKNVGYGTALQGEQMSINLDISDDPTFKSVTIGDTAISQTADGKLNMGKAVLGNLADGVAPTDAATVGQMNDAINSIPVKVSGTKVAIGTGSQTNANDGVAIGYNSKVNGQQSQSIGNWAQANGQFSTALGSNAKAEHGNAVAIGHGATTDRENSVSVGSATNKRQITNVAAGEKATDAANVGQMQEADAALRKDINDNRADIAQNRTDIAQNRDDISTLRTDTDTLRKDVNNNASNIAANAENISKNRTDIDQNRADIAQNRTDIAQNRTDINQNRSDISVLRTDTDTLRVDVNNHSSELQTLQDVLGSGYSNPTFNSLTANSLTMGGHTMTATSDGFNMGGARLSGIADGGIYRGSTDAVTGNQLWDAYQRMDDLQEGINIVGAHAAALSGLHPIDYNPFEPTTLSAAVGTYRDEYAVAVGVFHYMRENVLFNLGASLCSDGDVMGRAGISFTVGRGGDKKKALAPKDMNEVQAQLAQVQQTLAELKAENEALKVKLEEK